MADTRPIAAIVGDNVHRLRSQAGLTGDALARELREFARTWSTARVTDLEKGRVSPTAPTLFMLSQALSGLTGRPVPVAELLNDSGFAEVGDIAIRATRFAAAFEGQTAELVLDDVADWDLADFGHIEYKGPATVRGGDLRRVFRASGETEKKVARELKLTMLDLAGYSAQLWGCTFSDRRDQLAGADANPQKRGRVSRQLKAELKGEIDRSAAQPVEAADGDD
ncbi:helix-turn-helix transcriptional regulator [Gordonia westfalica]|uniref:Helix-turn-helix transcriptional regulator n=1 Tax=Gordonia westfalica TaxID=158898 RepID=A0ABU2GV46_9ACTN|nr:helix-turn-helix transcriptional regulator [Gordonia westfalica]MDS1115306.1 helix-turn-helix transcriptional regulator [Gordonia westfalica]